MEKRENTVREVDFVLTKFLPVITGIKHIFQHSDTPILQYSNNPILPLVTTSVGLSVSDLAHRTRFWIREEILEHIELLL